MEALKERLVCNFLTFASAEQIVHAQGEEIWNVSNTQKKNADMKARSLPIVYCKAVENCSKKPQGLTSPITSKTTYLFLD